MIKNFKLYNKPNTRTKLCAAVLTGAILIGGLTACSGTDNTKVFAQLPDTQSTENVSTNITKTFAPGEHSISIPITNPTKEVKQYVYHPGYKCIGMGTSAYGSLKSFGGACLLYINEIEVECTSTNGQTFTEFGIPLNYEKETKTITEDGTKTFGTGEHILSIPIDNPTDKNVQYQYYEGYEILDLAISAYGDFKSFGGGAVLYSNVVPVICTPTLKNDTYQYTNFGTPAEPEKILALAK